MSQAIVCLRAINPLRGVYILPVAAEQLARQSPDAVRDAAGFFGREQSPRTTLLYVGAR